MAIRGLNYFSIGAIVRLTIGLKHARNTFKRQAHPFWRGAHEHNNSINAVIANKARNEFARHKKLLTSHETLISSVRAIDS